MMMFDDECVVSKLRVLLIIINYNDHLRRNIFRTRGIII